MRTRRRNFSENDGLTITRRNTRSKTSKNGIENSEPIPIDLIIEILSRLPAKSIAKCRCVRKQWASILGRPDFTELFLTRSSAHPRLLFACQNFRKLFFFSASQPQNLNEKSSSIAASSHMEVTFNRNFSHVNGLVLLRDQRVLEGKENRVLLATSILNPSTGQSITLPKLKSKRRVGIKSYLGYDPISKQYKVLSMTSTVSRSHGVVFEEHQVLTLGTKKPEWRMIECCIPHFSSSEKQICINGVLYYTAMDKDSKVMMIVCFNVTSEKFRVVKLVEDSPSMAVFRGTLINYRGKLGLFVDEFSCLISFKLWILEDEKWSQHSYKLPFSYPSVIVGWKSLRFIGVTRTNEIVLLPFHHQPVNFFLIYYNIERDTISRVEIQGIDASKYEKIDIFVDHLEDVRLM